MAFSKAQTYNQWHTQFQYVIEWLSFIIFLICRQRIITFNRPGNEKPCKVTRNFYFILFKDNMTLREKIFMGTES